MYLFKTGLGQAYKPRSRTPAKPPPKAPVKPPPKVPADRLLEIYVHWELKVPFRKDLGAFRQEVVKAIGKHVAAHEKTGINAKLASRNQQLKTTHDYYSAKPTAESDVVNVWVDLRFRKKDHTGLDWLNVDTPPYPVGAAP